MKISVCMATYNGEQYIEAQIKSILVQLQENDELIISDDKSNDRTLEIISNLNDHRINVFINEGEKGYTKNFENALVNAKGDIIFLADQDDVWTSCKVEIILKGLEESDMIISNATIVSSDLKIINSSHFDLYRVKNGFLHNFIKTRYIGACMAFRKDVLIKALPFPKYQKYCAHDYWITLVGEIFFKVALEDTPLLLYRRHGNNASTGGTVSSNSFLKKVFTRVYCISHIVRILFK